MNGYIIALARATRAKSYFIKILRMITSYFKEKIDFYNAMKREKKCGLKYRLMESFNKMYKVFSKEKSIEEKKDSFTSIDYNLINKNFL